MNNVIKRTVPFSYENNENNTIILVFCVITFSIIMLK